MFLVRSWSHSCLQMCLITPSVPSQLSQSEFMTEKPAKNVKREIQRDIRAGEESICVCLPELVLQCLHIPLAWDTRGPHTNALRSQSLIGERGRIWERLPGPRLWTHLESCGQWRDTDKQRQTSSNFHDSTIHRTPHRQLLTQDSGPLSMELSKWDILLFGRRGWLGIVLN